MMSDNDSIFILYFLSRIWRFWWIKLKKTLLYLCMCVFDVCCGIRCGDESGVFEIQGVCSARYIARHSLN